MDFKKELMKALEIVKLNARAVTDVAGHNDATLMAVIIAAIAGVAGAIGSLNPMGVIIMPIMQVIGLFIGTGILFVIAMIAGGRAGYMELLRPLGYAMVLSWVGVVPLLGPILAMIAGLWMIVVSVVVVREVFDFTTLRAAVVVLIPLVIMMVLAFVLSAVLIAAGLGSMMGSGMMMSQ